MLTKEEHIAYWKREAERNWETTLYLQKGSQCVMALFMLPLVIEKLLKATFSLEDTEINNPFVKEILRQGIVA